MTISLLFWMIYIIAIVFSLWASYDGGPNWPRRAGSHFILWVLIGILGWKVFGPAIRS
jgi:ABC-type polysaccharide/polyol phosphate export permease